MINMTYIDDFNYVANNSFVQHNYSYELKNSTYSPEDYYKTLNGTSDYYKTLNGIAKILCFL